MSTPILPSQDLAIDIPSLIATLNAITGPDFIIHISNSSPSYPIHITSRNPALSFIQGGCGATIQDAFKDYQTNLQNTANAQSIAKSAFLTQLPIVLSQISSHVQA